jgi:predicted hotdog family 3-hydroxylacyl-ACP dehydratase
VEKLIPHGKLIRVVNELVQVNDRAARAEFTVPHGGGLIDASGRLDELAYIEMIAQTFAATHGFHLSVADRKTHRGFLLGVKNLTITGHAAAGDRLIIDVRKITRFGAFGVVEGNVNHQDGRPIAAAEIKVWQAEAEYFQLTTPSIPV